MHLALVYDDGGQEGTTGGYFVRAAEALGLRVSRWTLAEASHMPAADLHIRVDHGDDYEVAWPAQLRPVIFYAIDTHLPHSWRKIRRMAGQYDVVACCHRFATERLPGAVWVPVACDPQLHGGAPAASRDLDIAFVGTDGGVPRKFYLQALRERYARNFVGLAEYTKLATIYGRARIGFNYAIRDDVNMRTFEVLAGGSLLLTNALSHGDLARLGLEEGTHYAAYRSPGELFARIDHYLAHPEERCRIADAGREAALSRHTYRHRMEELLRLVQARLGVCVGVSAAVEAGGWRLEAGNRRFGSEPRTPNPEPRTLIRELMMSAPDILCDLVLLSWNHLEQTRPCLETLFETTTVPSRLFIVDNGSEPAVREFLRGVKPRGAVHEVVLLQHETNEGFPRGMNRGIRASTAPYTCLLNNDLRFTSGWLEELIEVARAHPDVGIVNPESNTFGNRPPEGMGLEEYAGRLRARRGAFTEVGMCIGFCFLITRELIARIGGLSEEVERIFFEDEDFSMRAQQAGYRCVVSASSYVWHAEHQTVKRMPEREALFSRNRRWCEERWGRRLRLAWPRFAPLAPGSEELRRWLEQLLQWARRRNHVYAYCPVSRLLSAEEAFRSVDLVPHADVHWHPVPAALASWASLAMILMRRKKPFDIIVAPDPGWARLMERLRWAHRATVVPDSNNAQLLELWKKKSRSPLSS